MKKIILFGAGYYGQCAYRKMSNCFEILCFVDNSILLHGTKLYGIPVISATELTRVYSSEVDVIICSKNYFQISTQLVGMGIKEYYVMLEGFLYHSSPSETMMPVELNKYAYCHKEGECRSVLYVQNTVCSRTHKMAALMRETGYQVYLLYTLALSESDNASLIEIYNDIFTFYTVNGMIDMIENSSFDIIHSLGKPDILTNIALETSKHVVFDMGGNGQECNKIEELVLEHVAVTQSDGIIYPSQDEKNTNALKYKLENKKTLCMDDKISVKELDEFYQTIKQREVFR